MSKQNPHFGEVIDGRMWDGTEWVPVDGLKPGDVIGEMMWTGTHWVPVNPRTEPRSEKPLWQKWWFIAIVAFLILSAMAALDSDPEPQTPAPAAAEQPVEEEPDPSKPGLDDPVVDGDLEFTVTDVDTGADEIPGSFNQVHEASGSFTLVEMKIKNVGDNPADVSWNNVDGTVDGDVEIESSAVASFYANDRDTAGPFVHDINPGAWIEVTIVFDVPDGMELETVIGHDSVFSDGAVVYL